MLSAENCVFHSIYIQWPFIFIRISLDIINDGFIGLRLLQKFIRELERKYSQIFFFNFVLVLSVFFLFVLNPFDSFSSLKVS